MMIAMAWFVLGAVTWSPAEYWIHDSIGHRSRGNNPFAVEHRAHHRTAAYFASPWKKALGAVAVLLPMSVLGTLAGGSIRGVSFAVGFAVGYCAYEWFHARLHSHRPRSRYGRWARRHHFSHHFHDPARNHGVTSPLWDRLFDTETRVARVRVPARQAMPWLIDPGTGAVRAEFSEDYVLRETIGTKE